MMSCVHPRDSRAPNCFTVTQQRARCIDCHVFLYNTLFHRQSQAASSQTTSRRLVSLKIDAPVRPLKHKDCQAQHSPSTTHHETPSLCPRGRRHRCLRSPTRESQIPQALFPSRNARLALLTRPGRSARQTLHRGWQVLRLQPCWLLLRRLRLSQRPLHSEVKASTLLVSMMLGLSCCAELTRTYRSSSG